MTALGCSPTLLFAFQGAFVKSDYSSADTIALLGARGGAKLKPLEYTPRQQGIIQQYFEGLGAVAPSWHICLTCAHIQDIRMKFLLLKVAPKVSKLGATQANTIIVLRIMIIMVIPLLVMRFLFKILFKTKRP